LFSLVSWLGKKSLNIEFPVSLKVESYKRMEKVIGIPKEEPRVWNIKRGGTTWLNGKEC
jgi:hypothetical protein